jgi:D-serine deaminase-like pyridoxal phosphate-dependent protein
VGICVAKLSEAEALVAAGVEPVLVTGPVVTEAKLARLAELCSRGHGIAQTVDSAEGARGLEAACARRGTTVEVLLDVDPALGRTGIAPQEAPELASIVASLPHLRLTGVQMYAGNVQHIAGFAERRERSLAAMRVGAGVVRDLKARGHAISVFTGGGTGTFDIDTELEELTDLQAGSYTVMDAQYLSVGSRGDSARFGTFRPALRVLTTVLSANAAGHVTVDAGYKALYRDVPAPLVLAPREGVYAFDWFGDEYGKVVVFSGAPPLGIGDILEVSPAHCDPTINLYDRFHVVEGDVVVDRWSIDLRGKSQ